MSPAAASRELSGHPASAGIALGPAHVLAAEEFPTTRRRIQSREVEGEIARLRRAAQAARDAIVGARDLVETGRPDGPARILDAHRLVLEDPTLLRGAEEAIRRRRLNAEAAFSDSLHELAQAWRRAEAPYLRERADDLADIGRRVLRDLAGGVRAATPRGVGGSVIVARSMDPAELAMLSREGIEALVLERPGPTSHVAILARSLEIPAVVGVAGACASIRSGDEVAVDGAAGRIVVRPSAAQRKRFRSEHRRQTNVTRALRRGRRLLARTSDGFRVEVAANIGFAEELPSVLAHGAEGVGLYRTEFLFLNRSTAPSEEEQFDSYRRVVKAVAPYAAIIRTVDLGGDKLGSVDALPPEANPALGVRGIRLSLLRPEVFRIQVRALLRASAHGRLKILYPMVSGVGELRSANALLSDVQAELRRAGIPFDREIEVGAMIEIPAAAVTADLLAREADFLSIGSNDLVQYTLAADRGNERVNALLDPLQPAVLRLIRQTVEAGHREGAWVGLCGEMASDPLYTRLLLGMSIDELSMVPSAIPAVKEIVRASRMADARALAERVLSLSTADEIRAELSRHGAPRAGRRA